MSKTSMLAHSNSATLQVYRRKVARTGEALGAYLFGLRTAGKFGKLGREKLARLIESKTGVVVSAKHMKEIEGGWVANPGPQLLGAYSFLFEVPLAEIYRKAGWSQFDSPQLWTGLPSRDQTLVLELVKRLMEPSTITAESVV